MQDLERLEGGVVCPDCFRPKPPADSDPNTAPLLDYYQAPGQLRSPRLFPSRFRRTSRKAWSLCGFTKRAMTSGCEARISGSMSFTLSSISGARRSLANSRLSAADLMRRQLSRDKLVARATDCSSAAMRRMEDASLGSACSPMRSSCFHARAEPRWRRERGQSVMMKSRPTPAFPASRMRTYQRRQSGCRSGPRCPRTGP